MNLKTTLSAGILSAALLTGSAGAAPMLFGGEDMSAQVNATLLKDTNYVALRAASQLLSGGAEVSWGGGTATVKASGVTLTASPGDCWVEVNGRCLYVRDGVKLLDGSVMVPVRTLAEAFGASVSWERETGAVTVTPGTGAAASASYHAEDLYWLSRIISAESRGEPMQGKLAVGTVVLNRVASGEFPDTVKGVVFDSRWGGQFTPVSNGTVYLEPTAESVTAAKLCLEGARAAGESLYFLDPAKAGNFWIVNNRPYVTTIGCHSFYL